MWDTVFTGIMAYIVSNIKWKKKKQTAWMVHTAHNLDPFGHKNILLVFSQCFRWFMVFNGWACFVIFILKFAVIGGRRLI